MVRSLTMFLNGLVLVSHSVRLVFTKVQRYVIMEELLKDLKEVCEKHREG